VGLYCVGGTLTQVSSVVPQRFPIPGALVENELLNLHEPFAKDWEIGPCGILLPNHWSLDISVCRFVLTALPTKRPEEKIAVLRAVGLEIGPTVSSPGSPRLGFLPEYESIGEQHFPIEFQGRQRRRRQ
jgi:hypothetical protein